MEYIFQLESMYKIQIWLLNVCNVRLVSQRQVDLASLVYKVSSRTARAIESGSGSDLNGLCYKVID